MLLLTISFIILGIGVTNACVDDPTKNEVDTNVLDIVSLLLYIFTDPSLNSTEEYTQTFHQMCNNATVRAEVDAIDAQITSCPALVDVTLVGSQTIGQIPLSYFFTGFSTVDQFCGCIAPVVAGGEIKEATLTTTIAGGFYTEVFNSTAICTSSITSAISKVYDNLVTCPGISDMIGQTYVTDVTITTIYNFYQTNGCSLTGLDIACPKTGSTNADFNTCMDSSGTQCSRRVCVNEAMDPQCAGTCTSDETKVFVFAVNSYGHSNNLDDTTSVICDVTQCDSASDSVSALHFLIYACALLLFID